MYLATNVRLVKDLQGAVHKDFITLANTLIKDWRILIKYHRKFSLPHLLANENETKGLRMNSTYCLSFDGQKAMSKRERTITIPASTSEERFDGSLALPYF